MTERSAVIIRLGEADPLADRLRHCRSSLREARQ
jgi:hypothetical protein